ncbi:hypothetical protein [Solirubrum puertoriconensis]|uniref:Uncharacterized protein n=1 Tax=Solirubrum puertoriconensis TaxID=1751427 RepID=A0A9X0L4G7_SOLP1|nr:hypothetical protein [Solirubrum puertoriconensis]KUG07417.1 hypothetical protein ASU33_13775 [Solirubrum puertoriconensis]
MLPKAQKKLQFYHTLTDADRRRQVELFEQGVWDLASRKTWVRFIFTYADNEFNRKAGRVGRISSTRIGTRNLDLIPSEDRPKSRGNSKIKRYYDVSRAGTTVTQGITSGGLPGKITGNGAHRGQWRSFRPNTFSIMTQLWSFERQQWVDRLSDFNIRDQNSG